MSQELAIEKIEKGENCFITGGAGVGKSWVIKQTVAQDEHGTLLVAPTGIASLNISGSTCHKAFGLPFGIPTASDYSGMSKKVEKLLSSKSLKRLVIDEIGMVRADYLDLMDYRLRMARKSTQPFGGIQVVGVGDFYQLEPIVQGQEKKLYARDYDTPFAFGAKCWNLEKIQLDKVYRQENETHAAVLNSIRKQDKYSGRALAWLADNTHTYSDESREWLHLCSYKDDAATINNRQFEMIDSPTKYYTGYTTALKWSTDVPSAEVLALKIGARVLITANDIDGCYKNGQRGIVTKMFEGSVMVLLDDGDEVIVRPFIWQTYRYTTGAKGLDKEVENEFCQIPLALGWAISIHKSQGMTLDPVAIDVGRGCFSHGQLYVGLSRAKDLTRLSLVRSIGIRDLIVNPDVKNFYGD